MNKKLNTVLFILGATVFNVLVVLIFFFLLMLIYIKFIYNLIPEQNSSWGFAFIFLASLAISFIVYRIALKFLLKKIDADKFFDPIFVKRNIRK